MANHLSLNRLTNTDGRKKPGAATRLLSEEQFRRALCNERKRSERSRKELLLMLVDDARDGVKQPRSGIFLSQVAGVLGTAVRETDMVGWFESSSVLGFIFTEFGDSDSAVAGRVIESKVMEALRSSFKVSQLKHCQISFYAFPDRTDGKGPGRPIAEALYPDLVEVEKKKRISLVLKRTMDILGSSVALLLLSPLFLALGLLIKLTSRGPAFFRQNRIGQYGAPFTFWKFRSMYVSNDAEIHKQYVERFITAKAPANAGNTKPVYKITNDPRITPIGRFMRRTSLDELPQFWNVLRGDMSLVGPRPPIPYEIGAYDVWHRRRLLEAKPGITGLWQVHGRSRTTFDEMVRLDLEYSRTWSPALDIKILLKTPRAVFSGDGAY
jgi:exopolysaccharide biosynthesis polyprenyl glycosylphosphotransferase